MTVRDLLRHLHGFRVYIHVGAYGRLVMPRELKLYYNKRVEDWLVFAETNTVSIRCSTKDVYDEGDTRIEGLTMQGGEVNSKVKPLGIRQPKRPVPKPTKPKAVINIDDIIDFIIKARPQTLITENYSISIFEKMQGSGSRKGVTKIIAVDSIDNSWAFKGG